MDDEMVQAAMQIILAAGDARSDCMEALNSIAEGDFTQADVKLQEAKKKITVAHRYQTDAIQDECSGTKKEYSLLFSHAQDTMMTIDGEINISKHIIELFKTYDIRLKKLEEKIIEE